MTDTQTVAAPAASASKPAPWWAPDPKAVIAFAIIGLFGYAYINHPTDLMAGALIAAFSGAWGYYLGSSQGAGKARDQVAQVLAKLPDGAAA